MQIVDIKQKKGHSFVGNGPSLRLKQSAKSLEQQAFPAFWSRFRTPSNGTQPELAGRTVQNPFSPKTWQRIGGAEG